MSKFILSSFLFVLALGLAACGGGDASALNNISAPPEEPAPVYSARITWSAPYKNHDNSFLDDLAGYRVHYGESSGNYATIVDVGNQTSYDLESTTSGTKYYVAVTAYDQYDNESAYSNEVIRIVQ